MSSLSGREKAKLERLLDMGSGYVSTFSNATFATLVVELVDRDIHDERYTNSGTSKANKLREFWRLEPDEVVAELTEALIEHEEDRDADEALLRECRLIVSRLRSGGPQIRPLKIEAEKLNLPQLNRSINRIEKSVEPDPDLAIGSAKELVETCCKTILADREVPLTGKEDLPKLIKVTLATLNLLPDDVPEQRRGADAIKQTLRSLGHLVQGVAELRGLYGTGHGKHGNQSSLQARHAKLAVGAAATLTTFLLETHHQVDRNG